MTRRVKIVDDAMTPTIGTVMRRITSEPVPLLHRIGNSPAMGAGRPQVYVSRCGQLTAISDRSPS
jgi:hypothetical protein